MDSLLLLLREYEKLGPIPGILLPMLESFLPILPLFAIIMGNAAVYGLWGGFFYSWIGVTIGSMVVFALTRRFGVKWVQPWISRHPKAQAFFQWIERKGFAPIFLLSCLPFSPSALINVVSGLSRIPPRTFFIAILFGKAIMIFMMSFIGYDLLTVLEKPWKIVTIVVLIGLLWWAGKRLERSMRM